jgi:hypothetical protein
MRKGWMKSYTNVNKHYQYLETQSRIQGWNQRLNLDKAKLLLILEKVDHSLYHQSSSINQRYPKNTHCLCVHKLSHTISQKNIIKPQKSCSTHQNVSLFRPTITNSVTILTHLIKNWPLVSHTTHV